jgi:hypothetical protein
MPHGSAPARVLGCHIVSAERSVTATPERQWSGSPTPSVDILVLRIVSSSVAHDAVSDEVIEEGHERVTVLYALTEGKKIARCGRDRRYGGVP